MLFALQSTPICNFHNFSISIYFLCVYAKFAFYYFRSDSVSFPIFVFKLERIVPKARSLTRLQLIKSFVSTHEWPVKGGISFAFIHVEWNEKDVLVTVNRLFLSAQETHEKLVKVKFSGFKPISTFHSDMEMKMGKKFRIHSCRPFICSSTGRNFFYFLLLAFSLGSYIKSAVRFS